MKIVKKDDLYILVDDNDNEIKTPEDGYIKIEELTPELYRILRGGSYGVINNEGKEILPLNYDRIQYSGGMIWAKDYTARLYGGFSADGTQVVEHQYEDVDGMFADAVGVEKDGKWGVYSCSKNTLVVDYIYDDFKIGNNGVFGDDRVWPKEQHLAMVSKNGKYGFINSEGIEVLQCLYKEEMYKAGKALGQLKRGSKSVWATIEGYELERGIMLQDITWATRKDKFPEERKTYYGNLTLASKCVDGKKFKMGILNEDGSVLVDFKYDLIGDIVEADGKLTAEVKVGRKMDKIVIE